jgi:hypothetical protein
VGFFFVLTDEESKDNKEYSMNFFSDERILFKEPNGNMERYRNEAFIKRKTFKIFMFEL